MLSYRTILFGLGLPLILGGCAGTPERATGSPGHAYAADAAARLARPLTIPAGEASVRLQYGQPVARNGVQETDPYCILEFDTVASEAQTVAPETFRIAGIRHREETFSGMPVLIRHAMGVGLGPGGGPSHIYYITEFGLRSEAGTKVRSLACQHNVANVAIPRHLTLAEMRQALGAYFVLDLAR